MAAERGLARTAMRVRALCLRVEHLAGEEERALAQLGAYVAALGDADYPRPLVRESAAADLLGRFVGTCSDAARRRLAQGLLERVGGGARCRRCRCASSMCSAGWRRIATTTSPRHCGSAGTGSAITSGTSWASWGSAVVGTRFGGRASWASCLGLSASPRESPRPDCVRCSSSWPRFDQCPWCVAPGYVPQGRVPVWTPGGSAVARGQHRLPARGMERRARGDRSESR